MKYKLVAVDVDGTLLDSNKHLSEKNLEAIYKAAECGVKFVVCSGRPGPGVREFEFVPKLDSPSILYNGAEIADLKNNKTLYHRGLEKNDAIRLYNLGVERNTTMCVWCESRLFCNVLNEKTDKYKLISGVEPELVTNVKVLAEKGISKILWYDDVEKISAFKSELEYEYFESLSWCTSNPEFLEFIDSRVSKGVAMQKLGEIYNISKEEMIAIGDGENDLPMIEYAGLGVAMANACDALKNKADYITDSNDEDGVANVLYKFCIE